MTDICPLSGFRASLGLPFGNQPRTPPFRLEISRPNRVKLVGETVIATGPCPAVTASAVLVEPDEQSLLGVHPVFGLIPDDGAFGLEGVVGDLLAAVGG
jgi:hypothetical protein